MKPLLLEDRQSVIFEILEEATATAPMRVRCKRMSACDERNGNGRVYPKAIWERELKKLQAAIVKNGSLAGAVDHPADGQSRISDTGLKWEKIWLDGNVTMGEAVVVRTDKGKDLEAVIAAGLPVDISSRGFGSTRTESWTDKKPAEVIQTDYELVTFDSVLGGSVRNSRIERVEKLSRQEGPMNWRDVIADLRRDNRDAFEAYESDLKQVLTKQFEQQVMTEVQKQRVDETKIRAAIQAEFKERLEEAETLKKLVASFRTLLGDGQPAAAGEDVEKLQSELDKIRKAMLQAESERTRLQAQVDARENADKVQAAIAEAVAGLKFKRLIADRLTTLCQKPEDVKLRLEEAKTYADQLLNESGLPKGSGIVPDEDGRRPEPHSEPKTFSAEQIAMMKRMAGAK